MDDILIRGGQVIDGTGAPGRVADVAIRGGRIAAIEANRTESADRVIDGQGCVVAPGFIDIHTHSDFTLPLNPKAESKIRQGVTTEVVGNCGFSVAPALPGKVDVLRQYMSGIAASQIFEATNFARYMDSWPDVAVNTVMQVGHNTLRLMAMGMENRAPREAELRHMQQMLTESLEAGALGLSSGLFTAPGCFADRDELRALGRVLRADGARYSSHIRDESHGVHEAVAEAIDVGEHCGVHVQIAHMKLSGTDRWGQVDRLKKAIDDARARGVDVHGDQYPYDWASNPLCFLLPTWLQESGIPAMLENALPIVMSARASGRRLPKSASITSARSNPGPTSASLTRRTAQPNPAEPSRRSRESGAAIRSTRFATLSSRTKARPAS
jgi:N-acyl-D-amino-acid deacylase